MMIRTTAFVSFVIAIICGTEVHAGFLDPISIDRKVYASGYVAGGDSDYYELFGSGVDPFDSFAPYPVRNGGASQASTITQDAIIMSASAYSHTFDDYSNEPYSWGSGNGKSYLKEVFTIAGAPYDFVMNWETQYGPGSTLTAYLVGPTGEVFRKKITDGTGTWSSSGYLATGQYEYFVGLESSAGYSSSGPYYRTTWGSCSAILSIPEPTMLGLMIAGLFAICRRKRN